MPEEEVGLEGVEDEPQTPEPEPAPEPEPEPELPPLDESAFDFLREQRTEPQYPQYPQPQYPQYPQYPQQPPPQPRPGDFDVNQLATDPSGYMSRYVSDRMVQNVGPVAAAVLEQQKRVDQMIQSQAQTGEMQLKSAMERAKKEVYGKSNAFLAHPGVKQRVSEHLRERYQAAVQAARMGDFTEMQLMQSPTYHGAVLRLAEFLEGYSGEQQAPPVGDAVVETPKKKAVPDEDLDIPPDLLEAAQRMGPGAVERLKESYKNFGDMIDFE